MEAALAAIFGETQEHVLVAAGVFARVGAALFLVPGLGERSISIRARLGAALAITVMLSPIITSLAPFSPSTPVDLALVLMAEASVGLIIGLA
ncbi:MAG: flagellar biosynthetic protein FliR, partial [Pseudomonadota bacterium]